jgi:hypothetical protein
VTDVRTGHSHDVRVWPETAYGWAPGEVKFRWHWNFPMALSVHERGAVYVGSQFVHKTTDGGMSWKIISPDLTTNDKSHQKSSGGINADNLMTFDGCTLYAIAESPIRKGVIWTGSNDGQVHITTNDGAAWTSLNKFMPALEPWGTISNIDPSNFDAGTAYISIHFQQQGNFRPYVYKVSDFGKTWKLISSGIPQSNSAFVHFIKEDPGQKGLLFAGTDNALYVSPDDGNSWSPLKSNLPPAPIYHLAIQKNFRDLAVATYGRGFYILDDITPLREWSRQSLAGKNMLLPLRNAYRFAMQNSNHTEGRSMVTGQNPPYGASINYHLADSLMTAPEIWVLNAKGDTIQRIKGTNTKGLNRVWWDLAHEPYVLSTLKTRPPGKDFVKLDSNGNRSLYIVDLDIGPGLEAPRVTPGIYTVVFKADGQIQKQPLQVLKDPQTRSTVLDIAKQYELGLSLHKSINRTLRLIDAMEVKRAALLKSASAADLALEKKIFALEARLFDVQQTGARWDGFRNPSQLVENLLALAKESQTYGADFPPTTQQLQAFAQFSGILKEVDQSYKALLNP